MSSHFTRYDETLLMNINNGAQLLQGGLLHLSRALAFYPVSLVSTGDESSGTVWRFLKSLRHYLAHKGS